MRLLLLTQYFPPEVGAPQNRLFELAIRLKQRGIDVVVLTAMPNYPKMEIFPGFEDKKYMREMIQDMEVYRSWIYVSKSKGILKRLINYFSFVLSSMYVGSFKVPGKFDYIMVESPPLFLAFSGFWLKWLKKASLIFNVSDLWPESAEKLGLVSNSFLLGLSYRLEAAAYRRSVLVTGQTKGICENINRRFPNVKTYWLPNGVDLSFYNPDKIDGQAWRMKNGFSPSDLVFLYAGILGHAQGLEVILKAANKLKDNQRLKFVLLGSGPEREKLLRMKEDLCLANVYFLPLVPKSEMPGVVKGADVSIIPLKKMDLFLGAIPSKTFEILAMRKPILLGVDGEAKDLFIKEGKAGLFFEPENVEDLAKGILYLAENKDLLVELGNNGAQYVERCFSRDTIANDFYEKICSI